MTWKILSANKPEYKNNTQHFRVELIVGAHVAFELIQAFKPVIQKSSGTHIFSSGLFQKSPIKLQSFSTNCLENSKDKKFFKHTENSH